jgi:cbb3-type cytochrome oxidase maturation protein
MAVIVLLIIASLAIAVLFLAGFIWAVKSGQFEDTCTPAMRILADEEGARPAAEQTTQPNSEPK